MPKYIYEYDQWPHFEWNESLVGAALAEVRFLQGKILGQMMGLGFEQRESTKLDILVLDIMKSSQIEGENLHYDQVRSSVARKLGIKKAGLVRSNRSVDGIVELNLDAVESYESPLTHDKLYGWHAALFPTGYSGAYKLEVGRYRTGEMQVVSGASGKERVHYEAVKAKYVKKEMNVFLKWLNKEDNGDPVLKAAVAHFWFIIIHPFDDGNGRIARAISDMLLARSENTSDRFYSISNQMMLHRKEYYHTLQEVQHSEGDITEWLLWFLECLKKALLASEFITSRVLLKAEFWSKHSKLELNERQRKIINLLFDGFEGKLQTSKWAKICKVSNDTALRDINDLLEKKVLRKSDAAGRSASYELVEG